MPGPFGSRRVNVFTEVSFLRKPRAPRRKKASGWGTGRSHSRACVVSRSAARGEVGRFGGKPQGPPRKTREHGSASRHQPQGMNECGHWRVRESAPDVLNRTHAHTFNDNTAH